MQPLAVDYPPNDVDCNAYPLNGPTDFGDDLESRCTIPAGYHLEVVSQPSRGSVSFNPGGWRYTPTSVPAVNMPDPFTFRVTNGSDHSNVAICTVQLLVEM